MTWRFKVLLLVGNKADREDERRVAFSRAERFVRWRQARARLIGGGRRSSMSITSQSPRSPPPRFVLLSCLASHGALCDSATSAACLFAWTRARSLAAAAATAADSSSAALASSFLQTRKANRRQPLRSERKNGHKHRRGVQRSREHNARAYARKNKRARRRKRRLGHALVCFPRQWRHNRRRQAHWRRHGFHKITVLRRLAVADVCLAILPLLSFSHNSRIINAVGTLHFVYSLKQSIYAHTIELIRSETDRQLEYRRRITR